MANTALELLPGDSAISEVVRQNFIDLHSNLAAAVRRAQDAGEITASLSADDIADQLLTLAEGMLILGRITEQPDRLHAVIGVTLDTLRPADQPTRSLL